MTPIAVRYRNHHGIVVGFSGDALLIAWADGEIALWPANDPKQIGVLEWEGVPTSWPITDGFAAEMKHMGIER